MSELPGFLSAFWRELIEANLAAGAAIALVLVLRGAIRRIAGAHAAYAAWIIVPVAALAVLIPARTAPAIVSGSQPEIVTTARTPSLTASPAAPAADRARAPRAEVADEAETPALPEPVVWAVVFAWLAASMAPFIWLAGVAVMLGWMVQRQAAFAGDAKRGLAGPAVAGFLRPRIVTPDDFAARFAEDERELILAHEAVHLARGDARLNAGVALTRCFNWFNPLIHIGARAMRVDQELSCDAAVIGRRPEARRAYAETLLKTQLASRPLPLGAYWPGAHPLTRRVAMLGQAGAVISPLRRAAAAGLICAAVTGGGLAAWSLQPERPGPMIDANTQETGQEKQGPKLFGGALPALGQRTRTFEDVRAEVEARLARAKDREAMLEVMEPEQSWLIWIGAQVVMFPDDPVLDEERDLARARLAAKQQAWLDYTKTGKPLAVQAADPTGRSVAAIAQRITMLRQEKTAGMAGDSLKSLAQRLETLRAEAMAAPSEELQQRIARTEVLLAEQTRRHASMQEQADSERTRLADIETHGGAYDSKDAAALLAKELGRVIANGPPPATDEAKAQANRQAQQWLEQRVKQLQDRALQDGPLQDRQLQGKAPPVAPKFTATPIGMREGLDAYQRVMDLLSTHEPRADDSARRYRELLGDMNLAVGKSEDIIDRLSPDARKYLERRTEEQLMPGDTMVAPLKPGEASALSAMRKRLDDVRNRIDALRPGLVPTTYAPTIAPLSAPPSAPPSAPMPAPVQIEEQKLRVTEQRAEMEGAIRQTELARDRLNAKRAALATGQARQIEVNEREAELETALQQVDIEELKLALEDRKLAMGEQQFKNGVWPIDLSWPSEEADVDADVAAARLEQSKAALTLEQQRLGDARGAGGSTEKIREAEAALEDAKAQVQLRQAQLDAALAKLRQVRLLKQNGQVR